MLLTAIECVHLDCGVSVEVDSFTVTPTYVSVFFGKPSPEEIYASLLRQQSQPDRTHIIKPKLVDGRLPWHCMSADLVANSPIPGRGDGDCGSCLRVLWFTGQTELWSKKVLRILRDNLHDLPWYDLAHNFDF